MSKRRGKPFVVKYMDVVHSHQPVSTGEFVYGAINKDSKNTASKMFARLIALLASRGFLSAGEVFFIATGHYPRDLQFSEWSPEQEIKDGKQPPIIQER